MVYWFKTVRFGVLWNKEIGTVDTIRFLNQFTTGSGNYTEERATLFGDLALDDVLAEIRTY